MDKIEPTIKVLHLIDSGGLYGAEKMLLTLCSEQIKQGLQSTILSCGTVNEEPKAIELEAKKLGIDVILWRMKSGLNRPGMHDIWKLIVEEGFTLLHSHGYKFNVLLALTRHSYPQVKVVATVHGYTTPKRFSKGWIYQWADKLLLIRLDAIIYVNQFVGMPSFL
ncbi:glycosyltransferase, partial [Oleiphilus sp. HI0125]